MSQISEKTWISLSLVVVLVSAGGSFVWYSAKMDFRVTEVEKDQSEQTAELKKLNETMVDLHIFLQRNLKKPMKAPKSP